MRQHVHHARQLQVQYLQSNQRFELCLHHVRQQLMCFLNRAILLKFQLTCGYHVDAIQCLVHLIHIKHQLGQIQFELPI